MEEGRTANPVSQFAMAATLQKKKTLKDGSLIFILDAQGRKIKTTVARADYDKYSEGQNVDCEFESTGDYTRFTGFKTEAETPPKGRKS